MSSKCLSIRKLSEPIDEVFVALALRTYIVACKRVIFHTDSISIAMRILLDLLNLLSKPRPLNLSNCGALMAQKVWPFDALECHA